MSLEEELMVEVRKVFKEQWSTHEGRVVPDENAVSLGNDAVVIKGTVLYADLSGSTEMVNTYPPKFSGEVYKTFLRCAARLIRAEGGTITAYDGDRIMGVFVGDWKNTSAVTCGLKINYAVSKIINPALKTQYASTTFQVRHVVGIDTSELFVAKIGARDANDLVWVGRAANYAAKLTELPHESPTWITHSVYDVLPQDRKTTNGQPMWKNHLWTPMKNLSIYSSTWIWKP